MCVHIDWPCCGCGDDLVTDPQILEELRIEEDGEIEDMVGRVVCPECGEVVYDLEECTECGAVLRRNRSIEPIDEHLDRCFDDRFELAE